jgi:hypothetical protein
MGKSEESIGTPEYLTLYTRCCRFIRVRLYLVTVNGFHFHIICFRDDDRTAETFINLRH